MSYPNPPFESPQTIARTPNPDCLACQTGKRHSKGETAIFHPFAGHGFTKEKGWSHPDLEKS